MCLKLPTVHSASHGGRPLLPESTPMGSTLKGTGCPLPLLVPRTQLSELVIRICRCLLDYRLNGNRFNNSWSGVDSQENVLLPGSGPHRRSVRAAASLPVPQPHRHCLRRSQEECMFVGGLRLPWLLQRTKTTVHINRGCH